MSTTMGQGLEKSVEPHVKYEEDGDNGLILGDMYLPEELITQILCYVDHKSLLSCQLVCKRWKILMDDYVWRKKAEMVMGQSLKSIKNVSWHVFYAICKKKPFERNLIKNHSGEKGVGRHWKIVSQGGDHWCVENPPLGVPALPVNEPVFEGKQFCFVTSYHVCTKMQTIKLAAEGLTNAVLDTLQPPIEVSEWYSARWDCPATYECTITLVGKNKQILDMWHFDETMRDNSQDQWHRTSHVFTNYGPGLEEITFVHGGSDNLFWAGHYGSKMAGASVVVKLPSTSVSSENSKSQPIEHKSSEHDSQSSNQSGMQRRRIIDIDDID